jgi:hypothetical protein
MLADFKLYIDVNCEITNQLQPFANGDFWDFAQQPIIPGAIYVIGRVQMAEHLLLIRSLVNTVKIIFSNPSEGSETLIAQLHKLGIHDLVISKKIWVISGSKLPSAYPNLTYDLFLENLLGYNENKQAQQRTVEIFSKTSKPYTFLFLNGRLRPHRKYMLQRLRENKLLDTALWTCLQTTSQIITTTGITLMQDNIDLIQQPEQIKLLDPYYEIDLAQENLNSVADCGFVKPQLFGNKWGEAYIKPEQYIDTYFSLITETVCEYDNSFRTEKLWRSIIMGHPWITVANAGFYRDLKNIGFKTFDSLINEDFDQVEHTQSRLDRILTVVNDLVHSDLTAFVLAAEHICKYNQQQAVEYNQQHKNLFEHRLVSFLKEFINE